MKPVGSCVCYVRTRVDRGGLRHHMECTVVYLKSSPRRGCQRPWSIMTLALFSSQCCCPAGSTIPPVAAPPWSKAGCDVCIAASVFTVFWLLPGAADGRCWRAVLSFVKCLQGCHHAPPSVLFRRLHGRVLPLRGRKKRPMRLTVKQLSWQSGSREAQAPTGQVAPCRRPCLASWAPCRRTWLLCSRPPLDL